MRSMVISNMPRSIQIYIPPQDFEWYQALLEKLASEVLTDEEAGQRGAKLSKMIQMLATAYTQSPDETLKLMLAIKQLAMPHN